MRATFTFGLTAQSVPGGSAIAFDSIPGSVVVDYETFIPGYLGVPDQQGSDYELDFPSDNICQIKGAVFFNDLGAPFNLSVNDNLDVTMPAGMVWSQPMNDPDRDSPVYYYTGYTLGTQSGARGVRFWLCGDEW